MKDLNSLMKQAQQMQAKMEEFQRSLSEKLVTGEAGGGMVKFTMTGMMDPRKLEIDPSLYEEEDKEILNDLIIAAARDAIRKIDDLKRTGMGSITGGLNLPGGL